MSVAWGSAAAGGSLPDRADFPALVNKPSTASRRHPFRGAATAGFFRKNGRYCGFGPVAIRSGEFRPVCERPPRRLAVLVADRAPHRRERGHQDRRVVDKSEAEDEIRDHVDGGDEI